MSSIKKLIKEAEGFKPTKEISVEEKKAFLEEQLNAFAKQYYRFEVDIEIGKRYIKIGEETNEDAYVSTGEEKVKESVQHMRSVLVHMERLQMLLDKLQ